MTHQTTSLGSGLKFLNPKGSDMGDTFALTIFYVMLFSLSLVLLLIIFEDSRFQYSVCVFLSIFRCSCTLLKLRSIKGAQETKTRTLESKCWKLVDFGKE